MSYVGLLTDMMARIGRVHLPTLGDSMWPTIQPGDTLEVVPAGPAGELQVGQVVIVACGPSRFAVYRVAALTGDTALLVGDNRLLLESPTPVSDIFGRVVAVIRNGRRITITEQLPFATTPREAAPCSPISCVHIVHGKEQAPAPGLLPVLADEMPAWIKAKRDAGIPILALTEQGRGDFRTLAHYATHYDQVMLVAGALPGYGYPSRMILDLALFTEAVRLPVANLGDLSDWLKAFDHRFRQPLPFAIGQ